jgi:hypothetical protein
MLSIAVVACLLIVAGMPLAAAAAPTPPPPRPMPTWWNVSIPHHKAVQHPHVRAQAAVDGAGAPAAVFLSTHPYGAAQAGDLTCLLQSNGSVVWSAGIQYGPAGSPFAPAVIRRFGAPTPVVMSFDENWALTARSSATGDVFWRIYDGGVAAKACGTLSQCGLAVDGGVMATTDGVNVTGWALSGGNGSAPAKQWAVPLRVAVPCAGGDRCTVSDIKIVDATTVVVSTTPVGECPGSSCQCAVGFNAATGARVFLRCGGGWGGRLSADAGAFVAVTSWAAAGAVNVMTTAAGALADGHVANISLTQSGDESTDAALGMDGDTLFAVVTAIDMGSVRGRRLGNNYPGFVSRFDVPTAPSATPHQVTKAKWTWATGGTIGHALLFNPTCRSDAGASYIAVIGVTHVRVLDAATGAVVAEVLRGVMDYDVSAAPAFGAVAAGSNVLFYPDMYGNSGFRLVASTLC